MDTVKVTVLMTLYNKAPYVGAAVQSVLDSEFKDLELLVVDDASTDGGPEVVRAFDDPRIRLLTSERNSGRAASANRGYEAAKGEYIAILDADDLQDAERLTRQVAFMDEHPEVGVCGSAARYFGAKGGEANWPLTDAECRGRLLFTDPVLYGSCIMRRSVMEAHGLRSNENWTLPAEDYLFMLTWSPHTRFANLPQVLMSYRIGEQNQRHGRDPVEDRSAVCREVFRYLGIPLSDEELEVHLWFHRLVSKRMDQDAVRRFLRWEQDLLTRVGSLGVFPMEAFTRELGRRRRHVFHLIADRDLSAAMLYLRAKGGPSFREATYLIKVTIDRWMGRGNGVPMQLSN